MVGVTNVYLFSFFEYILFMGLNIFKRGNFSLPEFYKA